MKILRIKDVISKVSLGQSTIYRMIAQGDFPKPIPLAPNRVGWVESEINEWLAERAAMRMTSTPEPE